MHSFSFFYNFQTNLLAEIDLEFGTLLTMERWKTADLRVIWSEHWKKRKKLYFLLLFH